MPRTPRGLSSSNRRKNDNAKSVRSNDSLLQNTPTSTQQGENRTLDAPDSGYNTNKMVPPSTPRGRKRKRDQPGSGYATNNGTHKRKKTETPFIVETPRTRRTSSRLINRHENDIENFKRCMAHLLGNFKRLAFPKNGPYQDDATKENQNVNNQTMPLRCGPDCDCPNIAQCYLNALAYKAAYEYNAKFNPPKIQPPPLGRLVTSKCHYYSCNKCGSRSANHRVNYYYCGQFGDVVCEICYALLLYGEAKRMKDNGTQSKCCDNGQIHTEIMQQRFLELQTPPEEFLTKLAQNPDDQIRGAFYKYIMELNNTFAYASVSSEKAPPEQMGGRMDTCKYNGRFSYQLSDLLAPRGRNPLFAQSYTILPEDALKLRDENISHGLPQSVRKEILTTLEKLMRDNPLGKTFAKVGELTSVNSAEEVPHFSIVLLTNRDQNLDILRNRSDCTLIERTDAPTAKQVAVIWVSEEGTAPEVSGFWVSDKAGKMRVFTSGMPQLDPCCFPVLCPRGTPGYQWFLPKNEKSGKKQNTTIYANELNEMQETLNASLLHDNVDDMIAELADNNNNGAINEFIEAENELDEEQIPNDTLYAPYDTVVDADVNYSAAAKNAIRHKAYISMRQYYRYMMAIRNPNKEAHHWLWFARRLAEFFVITVLNRVERNEMDAQKEIQDKKNYRTILARDFVSAIERGLTRQGRKLGRIYLMPETFAGSSAYYRKKYAELMTIVRKLGNPTWFVTFTGNPRWPEIEAALQDGQEYQHRADIVCRIFMDKVGEFIKDVTERHILGKVSGWCYSVEHQKRGMPHIHMLLIMDKNNPIMTPEQVDEYISARIPALPPMDDFSPEAKQQRLLWYLVTGNMLHDCNAACLKTKYVNGERVDYCNKHFPKLYTDKTILSDVQYANYLRKNAYAPDLDIAAKEKDRELNKTIDQPDEDERLLPENDLEHISQIGYKRLPPDGRTYENTGLTHHVKKGKGDKATWLELGDNRVISYNPFLLLKYGCHINIEYVFGQKACKYIFKYILKGFEKAYVKVVQPGKGGEEDVDNGISNYDEIESTFKVRYMCSTEAYMRLNSFNIVKMSHQIYNLTVHDEGGQTLVIEEGHEMESEGCLNKPSRLTAFFDLCKLDQFAATLRYDELPYFYTWDQRNLFWKKRVYALETEPSKARMFVRVFTVSPQKSELFAIRTLLLHKKGPTSFDDLRTVNGKMYSTFNEAARALGLLASDDIYYRAMTDASTELRSLRQLQHFFAMLMVYSTPSCPQKFFDDFLDELYPPPAIADGNQQPLTKEQRRQRVMRNLEYYFICMGTNSATLGLTGVPKNFNFETQEEIMETEGLLDAFYGGDKQRSESFKKVAIDNINQFNNDQRAAFDKIANALKGLDSGIARNFFVEGSGGTGKTFLYNGLIRWVLADMPDLNWTPIMNEADGGLVKGSVISAASTGVAALLLIGGGTVHRQFSVPNDVKHDTPSKIGAETAKADQIRKAKLIIIDEVSMLSIKVLKYIDRMLRDLCIPDLPFGGKVIVLGGDWKQLTPVVEHGTREDQVQESIKMDPLFYANFENLRLTQNMRTEPGQLRLRELLQIIGEGRNQQVGDVNALPIPSEMVAKDIDEIIDFCYPPELFSNPLDNSCVIANNAILCPLNSDVERINSKMLERLIGTSEEFLSYDEPLDLIDQSDAYGTYRSDFNLEAIHNETPSGLPPHRLSLKIGSPVMLIRNLDVSQGLCNGTRMQIVKMSKENLHCRILTGPRAASNNIYLIPRVKFEYGKDETQRGLRFKRIQFPIRPCFAMTINKAQGQTLQRMGLALFDRQCFSHGQVYVAMSRVTTLEGIKIFSPSTCKGDGNDLIVNVVFRELLENRTDEPLPQYLDRYSHVKASKNCRRLYEDDEDDLSFIFDPN